MERIRDFYFVDCVLYKCSLNNNNNNNNNNKANTPHQSSYKSISQFSSWTVELSIKVSIKSLNISLRMTAYVNVGLSITLTRLENSTGNFTTGFTTVTLNSRGLMYQPQSSNRQHQDFNHQGLSKIFPIGPRFRHSTINLTALRSSTKVNKHFSTIWQLQYQL